MVADEVGARIKVVPVNDAGELEITAFQEMLTPQVKLVSVTHVSNTLGTVTPIAKIVAAAHEKNIPVVVDGAQAAAHVPIDVTALDCDFYLISGHKAYGPTGIGVLYGKAEHLKQMRPYHGGGDMILSVTFEGSTFQAPPAKFEAGTPHISGAIGLAEALLYIESLGWENIQSSEQDLLGYALEQLAGVTGLRRIGSPTEQIGVVSFVFDNVHPHDVGTVLDQMNIAVRTGHHCTQPLMKRFAVPATVRISFAKFNTREDVDQLVVGLGKVQELFR